MNVGIFGANPYPREKQRRTQLKSPMTSPSSVLEPNGVSVTGLVSSNGDF
jgi:hypothetical protein